MALAEDMIVSYKIAKWHRWFAWYPVGLDEPCDIPMMAFWCYVERKRLVNGHWTYLLPRVQA